MFYLFVFPAHCCIIACKQFRGIRVGKNRCAMIRWFLFLSAFLLLSLGGVLAGMILTTPVEVKKDDEDE